MIYLTPERKLGRVIIAIWTGPIMPSLTVMSVQVLKTIENLCPSLSVPYMFPIGVFGIRAHSSEHFEKVPRLFSSSDARKSANSSYDDYDCWTGDSNRNL